ncbi:MAG: 3-oxoadipate enol-lactonase [Rhodobacterales bacterium]|nr:3-oxoadipate enol-lactonase [Rhodobacterales bacterium]
MQVLTRPWGALHYRIDGPATGPAVIFANSLGTDLRLWDGLLPHLPPTLRLIRWDKPGHGLSDIAAEVGDESLAQDALAVIGAAGADRVVLVGLSIGGLIGQALASLRPDLLAGLVLSNTAARLGTADSWATRIAAVQDGGLAAIADGVMERWFSPAFLARPELAAWRNMLIRTPAAGYVAACRALAVADRRAATAALRLPVLAIAGVADGATPPAVVADTAALIPGARLVTLPDVGHLPPVEAPAAMAAHLTAFLQEIGHV